MGRMRYRLSIDSGSTPIGWAMLRLDADNNPCAVSADSKRALLQVLYTDVQVEDDRLPLIMEIQRFASSVVHVRMGKGLTYDCPLQMGDTQDDSPRRISNCMANGDV
jgi:hypothetical protein